MVDTYVILFLLHRVAVLDEMACYCAPGCNAV